jgi:hypothetical protein
MPIAGLALDLAQDALPVSAGIFGIYHIRPPAIVNGRSR